MASETCTEKYRLTPFLTLFFAAFAGIVYAFPACASLLVYDRDRIIHGDIWRVFTCPWVHFSLPHLVYDLVAFSIGGWWVEKRSRSHFIALLLLTSLATSLAELLFQPHMVRFGGVSGLATGYLFYMALYYCQEPGILRFGGRLAVLILVCKVLGETFVGGSLLPYPGETPFVAEPLAHLAGIAMASMVYFGKGTAVQAYTGIHT